MSAAKVDVLAELDALIVIRASRAAQDQAPLTAVGDLQRAEAARAAVAELIETQRETLRMLEAARPALARAGGDK